MWFLISFYIGSIPCYLFTNHVCRNVIGYSLDDNEFAIKKGCMGSFEKEVSSFLTKSINPRIIAFIPLINVIVGISGLYRSLKQFDKLIDQLLRGNLIEKYNHLISDLDYSKSIELEDASVKRNSHNYDLSCDTYDFIDARVEVIKNGSHFSYTVIDKVNDVDITENSLTLLDIFSIPAILSELKFRMNLGGFKTANDEFTSYSLPFTTKNLSNYIRGNMSNDDFYDSIQDYLDEKDEMRLLENNSL